MDKRLQHIKIVEINGEPVSKTSVVAPSLKPISQAPRSTDSVDLIAQLNKNIQTLEALEFKFSYMLTEVKSLV